MDNDKITVLRTALEPLAAWARILAQDAPDEAPLPNNVPHITLTLAHARAAERALRDAGFRVGDLPETVNT